MSRKPQGKNWTGSQKKKKRERERKEIYDRKWQAVWGFHHKLEIIITTLSKYMYPFSCAAKYLNDVIWSGGCAFYGVGLLAIWRWKE